MLAKKRVNPLKICNLGWVDHVKFFLKKNNIKGKVKKTVKKYLAHVICKKDISALRYLAIVSMNGNIAHANRL